MSNLSISEATPSNVKRLVRPRSPSPASVGDVEIIDAPSRPVVQQNQPRPALHPNVPQAPARLDDYYSRHEFSPSPALPMAQQAPPRPPQQSSVPQQNKSEADRQRRQAKNQRRKERKQKAREQNNAGENNNSGNNSGVIGTGATSNDDKYEQPSSDSDSPVPSAPPTRMQTRSQHKSQPQARQSAPTAKVTKPPAKSKATEKKERALVSRARDFKRMFPGSQVNPGKLTKKEFKQLKNQHTNTG